MRQQRGHFGRAGGDEAQAVELVVQKEPTHSSVAQAAFAVEDYQQAAAGYVEIGHVESLRVSHHISR